MVRTGRALFLCVLTALAQSPTGEIAGVVKDPTGAVVPSAQIVILNQNTGERRTAVSNETGSYAAPLLPAGVYTVSAGMAGFRTSERRDLALSALQHLRVDFTLEVGEATQTVEVTAETPLVDTRSAIHGMLIDDRRVRDLPLNGRNALDLTRLLPGVNDVSTTIRPSFGQQTMRLNGGRQTGVNILLDGGSLTYFHRGQGLGLPPPDALQEFKVATAGTAAEYGRGAAVVSAVTRSGTNELHGSAWEFLRNDALDARSFFTTRVSKLRFHQFGVTGGGPVTIPKLYHGRNRSFWFFSYQGLRIREDRLSTSPSQPRRKKCGETSRVWPAACAIRFPASFSPTARFHRAASIRSRRAFFSNTIPRPTAPTAATLCR